MFNIVSRELLKPPRTRLSFCLITTLIQTMQIRQNLFHTQNLSKCSLRGGILSASLKVFQQLRWKKRKHEKD